MTLRLSKRIARGGPVLRRWLCVLVDTAIFFPFDTPFFRFAVLQTGKSLQTTFQLHYLHKLNQLSKLLDFYYMYILLKSYAKHIVYKNVLVCQTKQSIFTAAFACFVI